MIVEEKKMQTPVDLHYEILSNSKITHDFLSNAFKDNDDTGDEGFSVVGNPEFLKMINILQNQGDKPLPNKSKTEVDKCLQELSQSSLNIQKPKDEENGEFKIPESVKEIFQISNKNRKKNK